MFPTYEDEFKVLIRDQDEQKRVTVTPFPPPPASEFWHYLEDMIVSMGRTVSMEKFSPLARITPGPEMEYLLRLEEKQRKKLDEALQIREQRLQARLAELERRARNEAARLARQKQKPQPPKASPPPPPPPPCPREPLPPVPRAIDLPPVQFQETLFPLTDLKSYFLQEQAARWWVSNQSDDLLCLPYCRIERLDYQIRSALRVLGPLRGRALLSDEVGLGKTIEAGLVLKECLTRGLARKTLILTVPSLVDQWEDELSDKFNLTSATTNHAAFRADGSDFRDSQVWQAVNSLPRQFLLLLTATPVQNSLEDLYNLVTLLQPGHLPPPKEFKSRFIDKTKPHQPREPEELRRILGQVMIRNTRANAGIELPPRRAETVLFDPGSEERAFWEKWDAWLRTSLSALSPGQSTLWGRLLLQAAGSSPRAWRHVMEKYPGRKDARPWLEAPPLETGWNKKCQTLPTLARGEGGVVIFTQFLETQSALADSLAAARIPTWIINGQTPPAQRQPLTESFQKQGGALLLTHSGTEGRNLQFCHTLVNFDLPWNPMEIEQRIGRLHRFGQKHPVRIHNFVQSGTLQEHLLHILQEKLNLFELVVGETGLVLGDQFDSDEFAGEVFRRWQENEGRVAESLQSLGEELARARETYQEVKQLDQTLFSEGYETI
jgi:SNF2 family DNA or RNA helicase